MVDRPFGFPVPPPRERPEPVDPYWVEEYWASKERRRRRRLLALVAVGIALAIVGAGALVVMNARANYEAGKHALAAGDYDVAIRRLAAAEMVGRPYADAQKLLAEAVGLANGQTQDLGVLQRTLPLTTESMTLRRAAGLFQAGRYAKAEALTAGIPVRLPLAVAARLASVDNAAVASLLLLAGAEHALAVGDTTVARRDAAAVLMRYPSCAPAAAVSAEAARRDRAAPMYRRAATEVAARRWSLARTNVRAALRIDPAYPGATALLAQVDAAIAERKQAAKAAAAAAAAAAARSSGSATVNPTPVTSTAPQPPPP